jgi:hypothetical protein
VSVARVFAFQTLCTHLTSFLSFGSHSTLQSIHDFMFKAAQAKWISRLVAKTSIQDSLMQYDQQLKDAAMTFQVRCCPAFVLPFF